MTTAASLVTIEQLQQLIAHESAFTKSYGFVVTEANAGSCTLRVPHLPHFERFHPQLRSGPLDGPDPTRRPLA